MDKQVETYTAKKNRITVEEIEKYFKHKDEMRESHFETMKALAEKLSVR